MEWLAWFALTPAEQWQIALSIAGGLLALVIAVWTVYSWYLARRMELEIKIIEVLAADDVEAFRLLEKLHTEKLEKLREEALDHIVPDTDPPEVTAKISQMFDDLMNEIKRATFRLKYNRELRYKLQDENLSLKEMRRAYKRHFYLHKQDTANASNSREASAAD